MSTTALESLARKAKRGDRSALYTLCQIIANDVLFRAKCIMANQMDAEDVMQEVLIRVCTKIKELKEPKAFRGWLSSIIINETRRHMAKNSKHTALDIDIFIDVEKEESEDYLPQEFLLREEERGFVMEAIELLPERQREAVVLHYFDGMNVTETAKTMGIPQQTASMYLKLAREKVKRSLDTRDSTETTEAPTDGQKAAVLPVGVLMTQVLQKEAELVGPANQAAIKHALDGCLPIIKGEAAKTAAGAGAARKELIVLGVTVPTVAIVVATSMLLSGAYSLSKDRESPLSAGDTEVIRPIATVVGEVVFSGGDPEHSHLNPTQATPLINSDLGEVEVISWEISTIEEGTVLYSGAGADVSATLVSMRDSAGNGEYKLKYSLADPAGKKYTLVSNFLIRKAA